MLVPEREHTIMYDLRISIHAHPQADIQSHPVDLAGGSYTVLDLDATQYATPMRVSFEEAMEQLARLPRMFVEPDGSFVWVGQHGTRNWQLDGCLYDCNQHVIYVDVAGTCPPQPFDQLLNAFGWPATQLVFQLPRHAVFMNEHELRRYASENTS